MPRDPAAVRRTAALALGVAALAGLAAFAAGCGGDEAPEPGRRLPESITVSSPDFADHGSIPEEFTCDGADRSPALFWSGVPDTARALALVVSDPDASGGTYRHWVVVDVDRDVLSTPAGGAPEGGRTLENSAGHPAYDGPCPPSGRHGYRFTVYALRAATGLPPGTSVSKAMAAIEARAIARGVLVGTYQRG